MVIFQHSFIASEVRSMSSRMQKHSTATVYTHSSTALNPLSTCSHYAYHSKLRRSKCREPSSRAAHERILGCPEASVATWSVQYLPGHRCLACCSTSVLRCNDQRRRNGGRMMIRSAGTYCSDASARSCQLTGARPSSARSTHVRPPRCWTFQRTAAFCPG